MSSKTKKLTATGAASAIPSGNAFPTIDANGAVTMVSQMAVMDAMTKGTLLDLILNGVFIMYHDNSNGCPKITKPQQWTAKQSLGCIADGVVIAEGSHVLVIAPNECESEGLLWSSDGVSGATFNNDIATAMNNWNGEANTAAMIKNYKWGETGDPKLFALGFCNRYSRVNANGTGLTTGKWWLPSIGELMMMNANMAKINYALSFIDGATKLDSERYWSSTECNATHAWYFNFGDGYILSGAKNSAKNRVRPVSAFIQ